MAARDRRTPGQRLGPRSRPQCRTNLLFPVQGMSTAAPETSRLGDSHGGTIPDSDRTSHSDSGCCAHSQSTTAECLDSLV
eukprot:1268925-Rhodomonas_salina.5